MSYAFYEQEECEVRARVLGSSGARDSSGTRSTYERLAPVERQPEFTLRSFNMTTLDESTSKCSDKVPCAPGVLIVSLDNSDTESQCNDIVPSETLAIIVSKEGTEETVDKSDLMNRLQVLTASLPRNKKRHRRDERKMRLSEKPRMRLDEIERGRTLRKNEMEEGTQNRGHATARMLMRRTNERNEHDSESQTFSVQTEGDQTLSVQTEGEMSNNSEKKSKQESERYGNIKKTLHVLFVLFRALRKECDTSTTRKTKRMNSSKLRTKTGFPYPIRHPHRSHRLPLLISSFQLLHRNHFWFVPIPTNALSRNDNK